MNKQEMLASWTDIWRHSPSRRTAFKLLVGAVLGAALVVDEEGEAGAVCRKRGRCNRRRRCCTGSWTRPRDRGSRAC